MKVNLIQATPNAGKMIADIASICYGKDEAKYPERLLTHLYQLGHHSTFEHIYYTFKIEGISRASLAQLTRHRHASFTVESQRYTSQELSPMMVPADIVGDKEKYRIWLNSVVQAKKSYLKLLEIGVKKEDARFLLPEGITTNLYMSCNLRELIHLESVRNTKQAQWEIREIVQEMVRLVVEYSPELEFMFNGD